MYDAKIWVPSMVNFRSYGGTGATIADDGASNGELSGLLQYPITVRLQTFQIPDVEVSTYDIKYHGLTLTVPQTEITLERSLDLEFSEDAAFRLR
jgi:hypothetical protein